MVSIFINSLESPTFEKVKLTQTQIIYHCIYSYLIQPSSFIATHDVIIAFEERIFDAVVEDLQTREPENFDPLHVICLDTKDNPRKYSLKLQTQ